MAEEINVRVKHKGMTLAEWNKSTVILMERELGVATDTGEVRVGNGTDKWTSLPIIKGEKGDRGIQGIQGKQGIQGERGATGKTGARGEKGDSITVSSTTTDNKGNVVVEFSDGSTVTIPKGDKGERGATGDKGATGETGPKGDKGDPLKFEDLTQEQINQIKAQDVDLSNYATMDDLAKVDVSSQLEDYAKKESIGEIERALETKVSQSLSTIVQEVNSKANENHTHEIADVNGLKGALDGKASSKHYHDIADIDNLQTALNGKASSDHTHDDVYAKGVGVDSDGVVKFLRGGKWRYYASDSSMGNAVALKDHTHDEYLKKGDSIELTPEQKAELKGSDGKDGLTTFIRYANNPSGDNMTASPQSDTTHIGIFSYAGQVPPPTPSVYQWTRIKGEKGDRGTPGNAGQPGKGIVNTRTGTEMKYWAGSQADYNRIRTKDPNTVYDVWE